MRGILKSLNDEVRISNSEKSAIEASKPVGEVIFDIGSASIEKGVKLVAQ
jgi:hypothetical protein